LELHRSVPGGGTNLAPGDRPGDPFATIVVIAADGLVGEEPGALPPLPGGGSALPASVIAGIDAGLRFLDTCTRCVVICAGGSVLTGAMMQEVVRRVPGGIDDFGPGRRVEGLHKERSAEYGNLWESALLVKQLVKRQQRLLRFGGVRVVTAGCIASHSIAAAMRPYAMLCCAVLC
jgi:hypothetical protein